MFPCVGLFYPSVDGDFSEFGWGGFCYEEYEVGDVVLVLSDGGGFSCSEASDFYVCAYVGDVAVFLVFGVVPYVSGPVAVCVFGYG